MRYCVEQATAKDVALLALTMGVDQNVQANSGDERYDHLVGAFMSSSEVWAAHDMRGQPCALWGVGPTSQDGQVGRFWLLTCDEIDTAPGDLLAISIMILPEMLSRYSRLESLVDARNGHAIELLTLLGFTIEAARMNPATGLPCHHAWIDSDDSPIAPRAAGVLLN
jgi:hypothetical protein